MCVEMAIIVFKVVRSYSGDASSVTYLYMRVRITESSFQDDNEY